MNKRRTGSVYERLAAEFLEAQGFVVLERNYRCRAGEIDLIAREGEYLVFVEVKYRTTSAAGNGYEAVDYKKQQRIIRTAYWYLTEHKITDDQPCRFDVVSFLGNDITMIRNAFQCV